MEKFTIEVSERTETGKSGSHRCRREGFIPGVAYHRAETTVPVKLPYKEFTLLAAQARRSQVFTLKSAAPGLNGKSALVKDIQKDHLTNRVIHVDLQTLRDDEEITVGVPIKIVGESNGVKNQGGILAVVTHEILISCLPKNIPSAIELDVTALNVGQSVHAGALVLPQGVTLIADEDETVISIVASRAAEEEAASATPGAEGAAAAPAADAKGAAGAAAAKGAPAAKAPAGKK